MSKRICTWHYNGAYWRTDCGHSYMRAPHSGKCPHCKRVIMEVQ